MADTKSEQSANAGSISFFTTKAFDRALQNARLLGGQAKKRSDKAKIVLGSLADADPFNGLPVTNHGESRIANCVKYDLGDGWRLVTRQTDKVCIFLYVGDKEDTERWLEGHKGEDVGVRDRRLVRIPGVSTDPVTRPVIARNFRQSLVDLLDEEASDHLLSELAPRLVRRLGQLDGACSVAEIDDALNGVDDTAKKELLKSVLSLLLEGNVEGAITHIDVSIGRIAPVEEYEPHEIITIADGDEVRRLRVGSNDYEEWLRAFELRSSWHDWFLFLHPEQEAVVNADYPGVSQLSGVSGSGKTCVAVRRALRLAKGEGSRVLLLTLNRSLAGLLRQLVDAASTDDKIRGRIEVTSFFELAKSMLLAFEPQNLRYYEDVTWKLDEHVDEIFREFYRCWANNSDASVLFALQKSLNARAVNGETYLRQEFDWVRSAVQPKDRARYLTLERKGRKFPILPERRADILRGIEGWERKMRAVGVIDYLGLTSALSTHAEKIDPIYTNIVVDEAQDFGTTELTVVRKLVFPGANDIFLCGDIAQTVLPKHRALSEANILHVTRERIRRNYRNSREILTAAYNLLKQNLHEELFDNADLEVLDPQLASFSGPMPSALAADSLETEIGYARSYASTHLKTGSRNVCIAFAGFTSRDVQGYARKSGVPALDGAYDPSTNNLVFSDLEQTKGYEFDVLVVVNCCEGILPARDAPLEEQFRDLCKLYVAMTRAKKELVLSYHNAASEWIRTVSDSISTSDWPEYEALDERLVQGTPEILGEIDPNIMGAQDLSTLTGEQFLYSAKAVGLSVDAQEKLIELVDGKGLVRGGGGRRLKWPTMGSLVADIRANRSNDSLLGHNVAEELREKLPSFESAL